MLFFFVGTRAGQQLQRGAPATARRAVVNRGSESAAQAWRMTTAGARRKRRLTWAVLQMGRS